MTQVCKLDIQQCHSEFMLVKLTYCELLTSSIMDDSSARFRTDGFTADSWFTSSVAIISCLELSVYFTELDFGEDQEPGCK